MSYYVQLSFIVLLSFSMIFLLFVTVISFIEFILFVGIYYFILTFWHFCIFSLCFNPTFALTSSLFAGITLWVSVFYPLSKTLCVFEKKQNEKDGKTEGAGQTKNNKNN